MAEQVAAEKWGTVRFARGEFLFHQNEPTRDLFIIKTGLVRIYKVEGTTHIELDRVGPGMVVGEVASIDGGLRSAFGEALEETEAIVIPAKEFQAILTDIPDYFRKIAQILVQRLREVDARISRSIEGDRTNHVAAIISLVSYSGRCTESTDGLSISQKFIEHEIIDLLNIPLTEVDEILQSLEKKSLLKLDRGRVILKDRASIDSLGDAVFQNASEIPVI